MNPKVCGWHWLWPRFQRYPGTWTTDSEEDHESLKSVGIPVEIQTRYLSNTDFKDEAKFFVQRMVQGFLNKRLTTTLQSESTEKVCYFFCG